MFVPLVALKYFIVPDKFVEVDEKEIEKSSCL